MNITFKNAEASNIYNRVMSSIRSDEARKKADSMFEKASQTSDCGTILSAEEAKEVEDILNRYDKENLRSLGIEADKNYSADEVDAASSEIDMWMSCLHNGDTKLFDDFIEKYPNSPLIGEAFYRKGFIDNRHGKIDDAIRTYEELIESYSESPYSSQAEDDLVFLYMTVGDDQKALDHIESWLKRPAYTPINLLFFPPHIKDCFAQYYNCFAPSYEEEKKYNLFRKAFLLLRLGKNQAEAKNILIELTKIKEKHYGTDKQAKGALLETNGAERSTLPKEYLFFKLTTMYSHAEYLHYQKHDVDGARAIYKEIIKYSSFKEIIAYSSYWDKSARFALEELNLSQISSYSKALDIVESLCRRDLNGLRLIEYLLGGGDWRATGGKTLLQILLLNECKDVLDVRLVLNSAIFKFDYEVKSPLNGYMLMFKTTDNKWHVIGNNSSLGEMHLDFSSSSPEDVVSELRKLYPDYHFYSVSVKDLPSIYPESLYDRRSGNRFDLSSYQIALDKQRIPEATPYLKEDFIKDQESEDRILSFTRAFSILPRTHFIGLKTVDFRKESLKECPVGGAACYHPGKKEIVFPSSSLGEGDAVHEIVHYWDLTVMRGTDGNDKTSGDPSLIFYKISWSNISPLNDQGWSLREGVFNEEDFAHEVIKGQKYGKKNGLEDLATSAKDYVFNTGDLTRVNVRKQMKIGNFEPAAKYLFNKYVRSFDPEDGLCFEYDLSSKDPPLTLNEVKTNLKKWLSDHPGSVAETTVSAIDEIEKYYLEAKNRFELNQGSDKR